MIISKEDRLAAEASAKSLVEETAKKGTVIKTEKKIIGGKSMEVIEEWIGSPKQASMYVSADDPDIE